MVGALPPDEQRVVATAGGIETGGVEQFKAGEGGFAAAGGQPVDDRLGPCDFPCFVLSAKSADTGTDNFGGPGPGWHEPKDAETRIVSGDGNHRVRIVELFVKVPGRRINKPDPL